MRCEKHEGEGGIGMKWKGAIRLSTILCGFALGAFGAKYCGWNDYESTMFAIQSGLYFAAMCWASEGMTE